MQLLIGTEVLNITVQEALHDQTHLFLRHGKVDNMFGESPLQKLYFQNIMMI